MDVEVSEVDLAYAWLDVVLEVPAVESACPGVEFSCGDVLLDELGGAREGWERV
ncbi:hypothetical protein ACPZ19_39030 [Amycolatopsis lurida]